MMCGIEIFSDSFMMRFAVFLREKWQAMAK